MDAINVIGIICGCVSLFFGCIAGVTYYKLKQFFSLIDDEYMEEAMKIGEKQKKKIIFSLVICSLFTVATMVLSFIN